VFRLKWDLSQDIFLLGGMKIPINGFHAQLSCYLKENEIIPLAIALDSLWTEGFGDSIIHACIILLSALVATNVFVSRAPGTSGSLKAISEQTIKRVRNRMNKHLRI